MKVVKVTKRNRETGTSIFLIDNRDGSYDQGGPPWYTECVHHSTNVGHETRQDATGWMAQPSMWCQGCQRWAEGCHCMLEEDPDTGEERVMTHSLSCPLHPEYEGDN